MSVKFTGGLSHTLTMHSQKNEDLTLRLL